MEGQNFCGQSVTIDCPEIQIQGIPTLDFEVWFIDNLASLLSKSVSPKITPQFFLPNTELSMQVVISPVEIDNLHFIQAERSLAFRLGLYSNKEATAEAYADVLAMVKVTLNIIETLSNRKSFRYATRFAVSQSGEAILTVTITKTL